MRARVTAKIKITATPEIVATISAYAKAQQFAIDYAWQHDITQNFKLHYAIYNTIRRRFKLPSQLAVGCIRQACGLVKGAITSFEDKSPKQKARLKTPAKPTVKRASVSYNFNRSASLRGTTLVIRTLHKRESFAIAMPEHFRDYFTWGKPDESLLTVDRKHRCYFLFTFSREVCACSDSTGSQPVVLGIDLGVNNLAVCSDGRFFNSALIKQTKCRYKHLRRTLQAIGTLSAKRLLRKISGRETRWMSWINHNISKQIVTGFTGAKIVMEDLTGIRNKRRGKVMNYWINNWSFYQLQSIVQYKAAMKGIETVKVKPNYTSQLCHRCGHLGTRLSGCFVCMHCGLSRYSADLNAARNLAHPMLVERQATVTSPYDSSDDAKGVLTNTIEAELRVKSPAL